MSPCLGESRASMQYLVAKLIQPVEHDVENCGNIMVPQICKIMGITYLTSQGAMRPAQLCPAKERLRRGARAVLLSTRRGKMHDPPRAGALSRARWPVCRQVSPTRRESWLTTARRGAKFPKLFCPLQRSNRTVSLRSMCFIGKFRALWNCSPRTGECLGQDRTWCYGNNRSATYSRTTSTPGILFSRAICSTFLARGIVLPMPGEGG